MSVNRIARIGLFVAGCLGAIAFFGFAFESRIDNSLFTSRTQIGLPWSPWVVINAREATEGGEVSRSRKAEFAFDSWSWLVLGAAAAAFWARSRYTQPERPAGVTPQSR